MHEPGTSSGSIAVTAGTQLIPLNANNTSDGILLHIECTGGSSAGTIQVYDGTSTAGILLAQVAGVPAGTTQSHYFSNGVAFVNGLFVVVSGTGSVGLVHYKLN